jgi:hypothetical protein
MYGALAQVLQYIGVPYIPHLHTTNVCSHLYRRLFFTQSPLFAIAIVFEKTRALRHRKLQSFTQLRRK